LRDSKPLVIRGESTIRDALTRLNDTGAGALLLVGADGRLARTVTDGDLRRLLLAGAGLDATLAGLKESSPRTAPLGIEEEEALALLNAEQIDHLPVVDADGRPVGLLIRRDLDRKILLSTPHMSDYERLYVEEAFRTNWVAPLGPNVDAFEKELAAYVGAPHAAALSSGTAAIHLALRLLGVSAGDVVVCSSLTFVASANPILYQGATPVFVDSEPQTWNMSPGALEFALNSLAKAGRRAKAVVLVHLYGQSADLDPIVEICARHGVPLVEDAAESLGATYKGRMTGSIAPLGTYSFNGNKIITTSGGGMLVSPDAALIERARKLATQAREPAAHYEHVEVGYNYRMSNVLAGIGRGQLRVIEERVAARRKVFERYRDSLAGVPAFSWMPEPAFGRATHWLSACTLDPRHTALTPGELLGRLAREGIEARPLWKPMHLQPVFRGCDYYRHEPDRSVSDELFARGLCLPSGSNLSEEQQARIIAALRRAVSAGTP
jgi:dTDP-4-amino-4,6-dideoxygalactose transaminase